VAVASPNAQFYTVINDGDAITGDTFLAPEQVVVGDGGVVGMVAVAGSGNNVIIYSTQAPADQWNNQTVMEDNTPESINGFGPGGATETETMFNLNDLGMNSVSGTTSLTFGALNANSPNDQGFLQWNSSTASVGDVAFDGDSKGYGNIGASQQVNGSGQVLFPATTGSSAYELVVGNTSSLTTIFPPSSGSYSLVSPSSRVALGSDGSAAAELDSSGIDGVYNVPANGGTPTEVSGSLIPIHNNPSYQGEPVMGYVSNGGLSATLMLVTNSTGTSDDIVLSKNGSAPQSILASQFSPGAGAPSPSLGEMSPDGRIAVYVPDNSGADDTIQYANAAASDTDASVIASVAPKSGPVTSASIALNPSGSNLYIEALNESTGDWAPEVNDNGTIAFLADVGASPTDPNPYTALLDWQPGAASPTVLLAVGDQVNIEGSPETISNLYFNTLAGQSDFYNNSLSDDNYLAVQVGYNDGNSGAVLITQISVPEPTTMALLPMIGVGLLARRKRRH
jgi:hypothetical protein